MTKTVVRSGAAKKAGSRTARGRVVASGRVARKADATLSALLDDLDRQIADTSAKTDRLLALYR